MPLNYLNAILASYSNKFNFLILLKFDVETSCKPKALCTMLSFGMDSFHFHVACSTFEITFSPIGRIWDLWGIWSVDLSRMHCKVAIAYTVWACDLINQNCHTFVLVVPLLYSLHSGRMLSLALPLCASMPLNIPPPLPMLPHNISQHSHGSTLSGS